MKIGIITVATGKYVQYVESLIESCNKNFLKNHDRNYFVFTDGQFKNELPNVYKIEQKKLGWPFDTLMRFHMFSSIETDLEKMDYVFFFNANMLVVSEVNDNILPSEKNGGLVSVLHPGYINSPYYKKPFETNPNSNFFVKRRTNLLYAQGCFSGGISKKYLEMTNFLKEKIDEDLSNNIIPEVWDESAMNSYMVSRNPLLLDPSYAYPSHCLRSEMQKLMADYPDIYDININSEFRDQIEAALARDRDPYLHLIRRFGQPKIIQRDKMYLGGHSNIRS